MAPVRGQRTRRAARIDHPGLQPAVEVGEHERVAALAAPAAFAADTGLDDAAIATAAQLRDRALAGSEAFAFVEGLTTEVGPRLAGTEADARGVRWAEAKFKAMGFDKVYLEPVTFPVWLRHRERAEVLAPFPQPLVVTALGGSVGTGDAPIDADLLVRARAPFAERLRQSRRENQRHAWCSSAPLSPSSTSRRCEVLALAMSQVRPSSVGQVASESSSSPAVSAETNVSGISRASGVATCRARSLWADESRTGGVEQAVRAAANRAVRAIRGCMPRV